MNDTQLGKEKERLNHSVAFGRLFSTISIFVQRHNHGDGNQELYSMCVELIRDMCEAVCVSELNTMQLKLRM